MGTENSREQNRGSIRAYLAGVGEYSIAHVRPLPFCIHDRAIMREALMRGLSVRPEHIAGPGAETGVVTLEEFTGSLRNFFQDAGEEDTLIFYFSGHGVNREGKHCLMLSDGMVETQSVIDIFDESPVKHKILFLDCCMSGNYEMAEPALHSADAFAEKDAAGWTSALSDRGCIVFASSGLEHSNVAPCVYFRLPDSHISTPTCVLFTLPFGPDAPCQPRGAHGNV